MILIAVKYVLSHDVLSLKLTEVNFAESFVNVLTLYLKYRFQNYGKWYCVKKKVGSSK